MPKFIVVHCDGCWTVQGEGEWPSWVAEDSDSGEPVQICPSCWRRMCATLRQIRTESQVPDAIKSRVGR